MIRKFVSKPAQPNQSPAVDHLAKFVQDELILDEKGFCRLSALQRIYIDWCAMHEVVHRRLQGSLLLLSLEQHYGLTCGTVYMPVSEGKVGDGRQPTIYAMRGARLVHPALNARLVNTSQKGVVARVWQPIISGIQPDHIDGEMSRAIDLSHEDYDDAIDE